jgi:hypothetical protein
MIGIQAVSLIEALQLVLKRQIFGVKPEWAEMRAPQCTCQIGKYRMAGLFQHSIKTTQSSETGIMPGLLHGFKSTRP